MQSGSTWPQSSGEGTASGAQPLSGGGRGAGVAGGQAGTKGGGCLRWRTLESEGAELTCVVEQTEGEGAQQDIRDGLRTLRERGESS